MSSYIPKRESVSRVLPIRSLDIHWREWPALTGTAKKTVLMLHGVMDAGASFQFVVDHLPSDWQLIAPDWRGFGRSSHSAADAYWFPDYLGDLDALLAHLQPDGPVDLVAHSMGGNVATVYAGVRPDRVRRLVNLEGLGLPVAQPEQAPARLKTWLSQLSADNRHPGYDGQDVIADRLMKNNKRLDQARAAFLAQHLSELGADGRYHLLADARHRQVNPYLYRVDEVVACWAQITAPVLWVFADDMVEWHQFAKSPEYDARLKVIADLRQVTVNDSGHMMHHDQPEAVARLIEDFLQ